MATIIKDMNGVKLEFGDTIRNEIGGAKHPPHHFCCGYKKYDRNGFRTFAVCVNDDGRSFMISANGGKLPHHIRIKAASDYRFTPTARLVDGQGGKLCECCGSPVPIRSAIDEIKLEDNRFCYFCGAVLGG